MSKKELSDVLLTVNRLSAETGLDRRTIARHLRGVEPDGMRNGSPVYRLETLRAAFVGHLKQTQIPHKTNPIRLLVELGLEHFICTQAASLEIVWPELSAVKKLAASDATELLRALRFFLKWRAESYLDDDEFNAYLASQESGLQLGLDAFAGKLLGAKFHSRPTPVALSLPDANE